MEVLEKYEQALGQQINQDKTQFFFNSNTARSMQENIKGLLGVSTINQYEKYLGLPSFVGRGKKQSFSYIWERIWHKIQGWKENLLLQTGREIQIKAVIQAMPTFTMNCFKLPKGLCKDIKALIRKFWWGYKGVVRKIHWVSWQKLCLPKNHGGLIWNELTLLSLANGSGG